MAVIIQFDLGVSKMTRQGGCFTTVVVQNKIQIYQQKTEKGLPLYAIISLQNELNPFLCHSAVLGSRKFASCFLSRLLCPRVFEEWRKGIKCYPCPSRTSVRPSIRLSVRPSVRPYVPLSCPGHNSKTLRNIFMKLHRCIHHNKTMCHEQGRQHSHFWFLNYFPLT